MSSSVSKVWLDLDVGDRAAHQLQFEEFSRAQEFLKKEGSKYGLPQDIETLDASQIETLEELYNSNSNWISQGPIRVHPPKSIRAGRVVIDLFESETPKAAENFRCLCTGEKDTSLKDDSSNQVQRKKTRLHYKGTKIHRVEKGFVMQGGDITRGDGSGGESIYGKPFNDEKGGLKLKHDKAGVVAMANSGKNSNTSQFFISFAAAPKLDGKYVVFGQVVEGLEVLKQIEAVATDPKTSKPLVDVLIADCGKM